MYEHLYDEYIMKTLMVIKLMSPDFNFDFLLHQDFIADYLLHQDFY
jgi:hypothetical protein